MTDEQTSPSDDEIKGDGEAAPYGPDGMESDADIVKMVKDSRKESDKHLAEWLKEAKESFDLASGNQWSDEDKAVLEEAGRPCVTFNRIGPVLDSVSGSEVSNRQQVQYIPRQVGNSGVNQLLTGAAQWVRDNCDAEDEESDAFYDLLVCGLGWTETRLDYMDDAEGQVLIDRVDPLTVRYDATAKKRNLVDMKWVQREKWMTEEEIEDQWPDAEDVGDAKVLDSSSEEEGSTPHDATNAWLYKKDAISYDPKTGKHLVIHHQWYCTETYYKALDPQSGQLVELDEAKHQLAKAAYPDLKSAPLKRKVYKQAFVCGGMVLDKDKLPTQKGGFTLKCMTGKRDRNKNTWFGLVRPMADPQKWANKFFSQILHIVNSNAKGGLMIEDGAVDNIRKLESDWAEADSIVTFAPGALSGEKVHPKPQPAYPLAPEKMMEFSVHSIRDVSGVNLELMGQADRNQPGYVESHRKQAGMIILSNFFDSLRRYRKLHGRLLADFIQNYLSDGRLVKIAGGDGSEQYIPLLRQPGVVEYDVVVDESPSSHNVKERVFGLLMQALPNLMKMGLPVPNEMIDYLPIPATLAAKWKQQMQDQQKQKQSQPDPHVMVEQMKMQGKMQLEGQKQQMQGQMHQAELQQEMQTNAMRMQQEAQLEQMRARMQAEVDNNRQQAEAAQQHMKMMQEAQLNQLQAAFDQQKHNGEMNFDMWKAKLDAATKIEVAEVMSKNKVQDAATAAAESQVSQDI